MGAGPCCASREYLRLAYGHLAAQRRLCACTIGLLCDWGVAARRSVALSHELLNAALIGDMDMPDTSADKKGAETVGASAAGGAAVGTVAGIAIAAGSIVAPVIGTVVGALSGVLVGWLVQRR